MNAPDETPKTRRLLRPAPLAGVALGTGAAVVAALLLNPFGTSSAAAAVDLPAYDDCAAFEAGMRDRVLPRVGAYGIENTLNPVGTRNDGLLRGRGEVDAPMPMAAPPMDSKGDSSVAAQAGAPAAAESASGTAAAKSAAAPAEKTTDTAAEAPAADAAAPAREESGSDTAAAAAPASGFAETAPKAAMSADRKSADDAVGNSATGTNTQEQGVDEADLAKTDGKLLVTVVRGAMQVVDVSGSTPRPRGSVDLRGLRPSELLLEGSKVLIVSPGQRGYEKRPYGYTSPASTSLSFVDISDPDRPELTGSEEISARYLSARMVDGVVRVVLSATPQVAFTQPGGWRDGDRMGMPEAAEANRQIVRDAKATDWIPTRRIVDHDARTVEEKPLLQCTDIRHPIDDSGADMLTVLSIDTRATDGLRDLAATAIVASGDLVYASADKLFVATTLGGWGGAWREQSGEFAPRRSGTLTAIHAFDITGAKAQYLASGEVDGYIYGRWAMSERDGLLRVVTTSNQPWSGRGGSQTGVVVLDTEGKRLDELGRVDGMGFTENVRAVRWFDDLAAIVTFRQTDPLYLVDLSRPTEPRVRGELKIPGYSAYLHPIGDRRLLGIGQDANQFGQTSGLQVSAFDILDVTDPRRSDSLELGNQSSSPIEQDPRGFVYLPDERLAIFPMNAPVWFCKRTDRCLPRGEQGELPYGPGLVSVRVSKDGKLTRVAAWDSHLQGGLEVLKAMPLPGNRIALLDGTGVAILDALKLKESGYVRLS